MKTLVLNVDYTPLNTIHIKRALILSIKNKVKVLSYYDQVYSSEKKSYKIPAVVLYEKFVNRPIRRSPTKTSVFNRDKMICQYCSVKLDDKNATIDHIVPACRYTSKTQANTWENMVACCKKCNLSKKNLTPSQAGMKLIKNPKKPHYFLFGINAPKEWEEFKYDC